MNLFLEAHEHGHSSGVIDCLLHSLEHALKDTLIAIPLLFLAYLLMEFLERRASDKMERTLKKIGNNGPFIGSLLGCILQCGFSASASNLYTAGLITEGTLISVFLATSDEAFVVLLSSPNAFPEIIKLLITKIIIGFVAGFIIDIVLTSLRIKKTPVEMCQDCGCEEEKSIWLPTIKHTLKMTLFIFVINLALGFAMEMLGDEMLSQLLLSGSALQPFVTALVGLIPNCAVSAVITKLYVAGHLSFGSAVAGLCTGAGIGVAVLFKSNPVKKENFRILGILYLVAAFSGFLLSALGI
ncbi:MAG: arsenic efflux protein [Clostridia bacterium]|nr:arsenic efflux protein [Clostridia bacterium]